LFFTKAEEWKNSLVSLIEYLARTLDKFWMTPAHFKPASQT